MRDKAVVAKHPSRRDDTTATKYPRESMRQSIHKYHALSRNCLRRDLESTSAVKYPPEHSSGKVSVVKNQTTAVTPTKLDRPKRRVASSESNGRWVVEVLQRSL